jgi:Tfp pilus assembly protein PilV
VATIQLTKKKNKTMGRSFAKEMRKSSGFALLEMIIAIAVLLVGILAVAKLVPLSSALNSENRHDSMALVIAQRQLDGLLIQPLGNNTFSDPQGLICPAGNNCQLGNPATPKVVVGSGVVMFGVRPAIDFTAAQVANYSFNYTDPNDPASAGYDVRWAVISFSNGGAATGRRFIVGVRRLGGNTPLLPVTIDGMIEK